MSTRTGLPDTASAVLTAARAHRREADGAEVKLLLAALDWAIMHPAESLEDAATVYYLGVDTAIPVAGPGAPLVAEFAIAEFAAAIGASTEGGKGLIGDAVELRYRLPRVFARVSAGDLPVWRARRVCAHTIGLSPAGAAFVDQHVAAVAHKIRPAELERLLTEAVARFEPKKAEETADTSAERRHVTFHHDQIGFDGTIRLEAALDIPDAYDLDAAVQHGAEVLKALGSADSLNVRRSLALGELARNQPQFAFGDPEEPGDAKANAAGPAPVKRQVVLYVHLSEAALHETADDCFHVGRFEKLRRPLTSDQVREWCANPDADVVVKPVIDLNQQVRVDQYEVPDRLREHVVLRDGSCVFPHCTRPARSCDIDHIHPHSEGGLTDSLNLAPLCRKHHRLKTHGGWTYTSPEPGVFIWSTPHGYAYLRDHTGTADISSKDPPTLNRDQGSSVHGPSTTR